MLDYYGNLMEKCDENLIHIDFGAMREGFHLNAGQRASLIVPVSDQEIISAFHGIGDMKAPWD